MSEDREARAGEYVLGTLSQGERAAFERELASAPDLAAAVRRWEARLSPLAHAVPEVAPSPEVWPAIEARLDAPPATVVQLADHAGPHRLRRSLARWRAAALGAGALAASLAVALVLDRTRPTGADQQYVAVVNRGGELPALVVRVDTTAGTVHVRPLAAEAPADRSLELWYIGPDRAPRSMGLVDGPARRGAMPVALKAGTMEGATLAVTMEPKGGSPTGGPTGPIVYSGKLIKDER